MASRAKDGASLEALIRLAIPVLKDTERQYPRTGRGAKPQIPDWFMGLLIMIAVLKRKKSKSAQFRFLSVSGHRQAILNLSGQTWFPSRTTFFDRYRRAQALFQKAIEVQGRRAVAEGVADPKHVAVDKSLLRARGPAWHKQDRQRGRISRGVDIEGTWGYSEHHGWVYGYSFEVVVTATTGSRVFPLLATADVASAAETRTFAAKIPALTAGIDAVLADSGYDANHLGEAVEDNGQSQRGRRRYLCPENPRNHGRPKTKPCNADAARARSRAFRAIRKKYLESRTGRRIYQRRSRTIEPFNSWFKELFELGERVWHRGLQNNQTQVLASIFIYQLLVRYNVRRGRTNATLKPILDML